MLNPFTGINEEIDIHQTRSRLQNPTSPHTRALTTIIIYASAHYPHTKQTLLHPLLSLTSKHPQALQAAITHLYSCIEREIITGPSSSYLPPKEVPETHHQDILMQVSLPSHTQEGPLWQSIQELGLEGLFEREDARELAWYDCERMLSMKGAQQQREGYRLYQNELELEGECWLQTTPFPALFLTISYLLRHLLTQ